MMVIRTADSHRVVSIAVWMVALAVIGACARRESPTNRMADALRGMKQRPTLGRLADAPFAPASPRTRGAARFAEAGIRVQALAADLSSEAGPNAAETRHAQAVAELLAGNAQGAVIVLDRLSRQRAKDARTWNDLAAARLELARQTDDVELLANALAAAEYAVRLQPSMEAAAFNRAVVLDELRIGPAAQRAFREYLVRDSNSAWANEARARVSEGRGTAREEWKTAVQRLEVACASADAGSCAALVRRFPQQARSWGEGEYLARWGAAFSAGKRDEAARWLTVSRNVGHALRESTGEELLFAAVAAVDRAVSGDAARARQLAEAHVLYRTARIQYSKRSVSVAAPAFVEVERRFRSCGSPMALVAAYYRANAAYDGNEDALAVSVLQQIADAASPNYKALRAQVEWTRSLLSVRNGRLWEGLQSVTSAKNLFVALGETDNTTAMRSLGAGTLIMLGRPADAWRERRDIFEAVTESGNASLVESTLAAAAVDAMVDEQWPIAAALFSEQATLTNVSPRKHAEALLFATYTAALAGWIDPPSADFNPSRVAAAQISDPKLRDETVDGIRFAESRLTRQSSPQRALQLLNDCVDFRSRQALTLRLREAYVERAKALRAVGQSREALLDLDRAITSLEQTRTGIGRDDLRDSFFGTAGNAFEEAIDLHLSRGDYAAAFDVAERGRARMLLDRLGAASVGSAQPWGLAEIQRHLPPDTALLVLSTLADRTFAAAVTSQRFQGAALAVQRHTIETTRDAFLGAIERRDTAAVSTLGRQLFELLLAPIQSDLAGAKTVVVVADDVLAGIPFAALVDPRTGRFLVEDKVLALSPSANTFVRGTAPVPRSRLRVALVGDPAFDGEQFPRLSRLPAARQEATRLASLYADETLLTDSSATPRRVKAAIADADVVDIAAHTVVNERNPQVSVLLLAPGDGESGSLYLSDAAALRLDRSPTVVLAGCQTAVAGKGRATVRSFALAFLSAGSRAVLGTLWNVDDVDARALSLAFHERIRSGVDPPEAMRDAQLQMLHAGGAASAPKTWAGYGMYIGQRGRN